MVSQKGQVFKRNFSDIDIDIKSNFNDIEIKFNFNKIEICVSNNRAFCNFHAYTHLENPPYRISPNSQRFELSLFIASHVALTIPVLRLCCHIQTHGANTTLCSLFSCGLLHTLQPSKLYGWEVAQLLIMAFLSLVLQSYWCVTAW